MLLQDRKPPGRFRMYETLADEAALQAHMVSPPMKALLAGEIQQDFLSVLVDG